MILLTETVSTKPGAYMLSKYGDIIPVKYHPYGSNYNGIDTIEDNVACAYFLYLNNIHKQEMERLFFNYICYCVDYCADNLDYEDLELTGNNFKTILFDIFEDCGVDDCLQKWNNTQINAKEFLFQFVKDKTLGDLLDSYDENENGFDAYMYLNQNFTRFRIGGEYDNDNENEIYFRISSSGYDWGSDIVDIVFKNYMNIKYITIERDSESSPLVNKSFKVYSINGVPINHMLVKDFVFVEHIPICASYSKVHNKQTRIFKENHYK